MPSLGDLQTDVRRALTSGDASSLAALLVGGVRPVHRLAIHQRHYRASLVTALLEKFPATAWLIGSDALAEAAHAFALAQPPTRPCIAEYGSDFPVFLAAFYTDALPDYVRSFAEMEWAVAQASIAIDGPAARWEELVALGADVLPSLALNLQPGLGYVYARHAIDDVLKVCLTASEPEEFTLVEGDVWIQVRGARGDVGLARLDVAAFTFRSALLTGLPLGDAVEQALQRDAGFDTSSPLRSLFSEGLVTSIGPHPRGRG